MQTDARALSFQVFIQNIQAGNTGVTARKPGTGAHLAASRRCTNGESAHYARNRGFLATNQCRLAEKIRDEKLQFSLYFSSHD